MTGTCAASQIQLGQFVIRPAVAEAEDHYFCCTDRIAVCGAALPGGTGGRLFPNCRDCIARVNAGAACPIPGCTGRRRKGMTIR